MATVLAPEQWPALLMKESAVLWRPIGGSVGPGITMAGTRPVVRTTGGAIWGATLSEVAIRTREEVMVWRALEAILDQGMTPVRVPSCESRYAPWPVVGGQKIRSIDQVPHDDEAFFDDDTGYADRVIQIKTQDAASLRATEMTITKVYGSQPEAGCRFSILHPTAGERMYTIAKVFETDVQDRYDVVIRRPLREAVTTGTWLNFDDPGNIMTLASGDAMDLLLEQRKRSSPTVSFLEAD